MKYRRLKSDEVIQEGDQYQIENTWVMSGAIGCIVECDMEYRRPIPEPATFDEASNFEPIQVSQEAVIYPKADDGLIDPFGKQDKRPKLGAWAPGDYTNKCVNCGDRFTGDKRACSCADCAYKVSEPDVCNEALLLLESNFINVDRMALQIYLARLDEHGMLVMPVFTRADQLELKKKVEKEKAIESALELYTSDRVIPPTPNQLGVLWDNGLLNITK